MLASGLPAREVAGWMLADGVPRERVAVFMDSVDEGSGAGHTVLPRLDAPAAASVPPHLLLAAHAIRAYGLTIDEVRVGERV